MAFQSDITSIVKIFAEMRLLDDSAASTSFDSAAFLASAGLGRRIVELKPGENFFSQGDLQTPSSIFRRAAPESRLFRRSVKEATIMLLSVRDFVGEEALAAVSGLRLAAATAVTACTAFIYSCRVQ
jgi:CRP/FNR family transcriptional regulator, cyclic AMP receptor protein